MPYIVLEIKSDGKIIKTIQPKMPGYDQLRKAVDGYFQEIPYFKSIGHEGAFYKGGSAYANEEGRMMGLPFNTVATQCWMLACPNGEPDRMRLCGDVIFFAKVK